MNSDLKLCGGAVKHMREMKFHHSPVSSLPVKVEVISSDEENIFTLSKLRSEMEDVKCEDKCIQTNSYLVQKMIGKLVASRMRTYTEAAKNDEQIDRKLSPLLLKLRQENTELHEKARSLKLRLDMYEKEHIKRPADKPLETGPAKRADILLETGPAKRADIKSSSISPNDSISRTLATIPKIYQPPVYQPSPRTASVQPSQRVQEAQLPGGPQQQYHLVPVSGAYQQQGMLMQTGGNVQRPPPGYGYPAGESFMVVDNQLINTGYGVSTQVVASNQGLRMASHPNDGVIQRPVYSSTFKGGSGVSTTNKYQPVQPNNIRKIVPSALWSQQQKQLQQQKQQQQQQQQQQQKQQHQPSRNYNLSVQSQPPQMSPQPPQSKHQYNPQNTPITKTTSNNQMTLSPPNHTFEPRQKVPNIALPFNPLPKLKASISASGNGIILTWDYDTPSDNPDKYKVECYQLFAHQAKNHTSRTQPSSEIKQWKKIGVVNALPLPMACTLTQFATGNVYYFAVVAVDIHGREGEMSNPCVIRLNLNP